ncbi:DUF5302 domain-containing protein [Actinomycetota bacterium]|nr:DUF5302 domain-containing protein [Micrococcales bacterium]
MSGKGSHEPAPDSVKEKMREALERKKAHGGADVSEHGGGSKVGEGHGPDAQRQMFRRKAGG